MQVQLGQVEGNQQKSLLAAVGVVAVRGGEFFVHIAPRFGQRLRQQGHVFVGPFDAIERSFGRVTQLSAFVNLSVIVAQVRRAALYLMEPQERLALPNPIQ